MADNYRVNRQIRAREVRLVGLEGEYNNKIVPLHVAVQLAQDADLDLVEVSPNSAPPVCRIMDFGKFAYEKTRKEREARSNQKKIETKTIRLRPKIADFHRDIQVKRARGWLEKGMKVKVLVRFQGREIQYPEIGRLIVVNVAEELKDIATVEQPPTLEGWSMTLLLNPTGVVPPALRTGIVDDDDDGDDEDDEDDDEIETLE